MGKAERVRRDASSGRCWMCTACSGDVHSRIISGDEDGQGGGWLRIMRQG